MIIWDPSTKDFTRLPSVYNSEDHCYAHICHLYRKHGNSLNIYSLDKQLNLEMPVRQRSIYQALLSDPHEIYCAKFSLMPPGQNCNCVYSQTSSLKSGVAIGLASGGSNGSSNLPPGYPYNTSAPSAPVQADLWDEFFEPPSKRSGGFDPLHTCIESTGPLFREGTGKQYTFCKICGKWMREWVA